MSIESKEVQIKEEPKEEVQMKEEPQEEVPCIQFDVKIKQEDEVFIQYQDYNYDSFELKQESSNAEQFSDSTSTETFVATEDCRDLKDKLRARLGAILKKTNLFSDLRLNQLQKERTVLIPKRYRKVQEFRCKQCTFTTMWKTSLNNHIKGRHYRQKFQCPECDFVTTWKSNLITHAKGCHGLQAFNCHHCSASLKWRRYLSKHHLPSIMSPILGSVEYRCHNCDFNTRMRGKLIRHVKGCHGFEKFKCKQCDFVTRWKANLTNHVRVCHGSAELKCTECTFTTKRKLTLIKHIKGRHGS